ncbi:MAG: hypothetical protein HMLIMOIP_002092 [Candidatus Nitrosomirales archaeon]|jgi:hypothetical protein
MTYPDNSNGLTSVGEIFTAEGRDADKLRERLVAIGMQWFHVCQEQRIKQERQWYLNLAFYYGNQHVQFRQVTVNGAFDLYTPKAPRWRVRIVVNQIRKIIRKEISRLTAQKPNAFVVPASSEDADVFAAQAGEQIWDSLWREKKLNKTLRDVIFWQAVCGNGFIKAYWDPNAIAKNGSEDPGSESTDVYGDICIEKVTPFHIYVPDLMSTELEDQPYIIHAQIRNNSWLRQNFGIEAGTAKLESVDDSLYNAMGISRNDNKKDQSIILEIWVKPGYLPELPNGGMFTIAANKLVQGFDQWPYEHGQYPFAKLDGTPTGKFYTSSIIEDLIPLQQELNRSRSQLIESKNRMSKPQILAEKGSVEAKKITTEPGQVIEYAMGHTPPQPLPLQNLPSYVTEEINRLYDDMADVSGQHEVSNGSTPPGVTAATAISFLQEQDETMIAGNYSSIEEAIEKVAAQCLTYVKMYWDEARTVKIVGLDGTFDVQIFKNSDLRGNTDVRVESGSALPTSRAAKQAFIMDLMKMGFIQPDEGLEILEVGGLNRIYERIQVDKRQAQRENLKMRVITEEDIQKHTEEWQNSNPEGQKDIDAGLKLEPPPIVPTHTYDNHELHIQIHNMYRKSQNFESASPVTKILFEEHVRHHMEASMAAFTGRLPVDPNSLPTNVEQQDQGQETTGPEPMPTLEGEQQPTEGAVA